MRESATATHHFCALQEIWTLLRHCQMKTNNSSIKISPPHALMPAHHIMLTCLLPRWSILTRPRHSTQTKFSIFSTLKENVDFEEIASCILLYIIVIMHTYTRHGQNSKKVVA